MRWKDGAGHQPVEGRDRAMSKKKPKKKDKSGKKGKRTTVSKKAEAQERSSEANAQRYLDWRARAS